MKTKSKLIEFLSQKPNLNLLIFSLFISVALGNITQQFFLRFLLTSYFRIAIITLVVIIFWLPITFYSIRNLIFQHKAQLKPTLAISFGLSCLVALLFYLYSPIKITGNLILLEQAPIFLYRISRLMNIISFFLSFSFLLMLMFSGLQRKLDFHRLWSIVTMLFFTAVLLIGLFSYKDYGISSDEPNERTNGLVSAKYLADYLTEKLPDIDPYLPKLSTYRYRYYGVAYQLPMAIIEQNTMLKEDAIWQFRHLSNFVFFSFGVLAFFHLASDVFEDGRLGLLAAIFLVVSPRIFAHAFFNPKDSVFLAAFTVALYFCNQVWKNPSYRGAFLAGIACAFAANIRIIAIALVIITLGVFLIDFLKDRNKNMWRFAALMLLTFLVFLILFWPASWESPLKHITNAIFLFADYTYWDLRIMYLGKFIKGADAPWHYLPVWMAITIPITYIALFILGTSKILLQTVKLKLRALVDHQTRSLLIFLCIFLIPPMLAIVLGSTLYNGWRHFQFTYPSFLLVAMLGIREIIKHIPHASTFSTSNLITKVLLGSVAINVIFVAFWMVQNHPFQFAYYNQIGKSIGRENFERDYWRVSMKLGLASILETDDREIIHICTEEQFSDPAFLMILPTDERNRIRIIYDEPSEIVCDYAIVTYRFPDMFKCQSHLQSFQADGLPILSIYQCD